jgi:hypothetical protein
LVLCSIPKLKDGPLSAFRDCLFSIFAAILHPLPEDTPSRANRDTHCPDIGLETDERGNKPLGSGYRQEFEPGTFRIQAKHGRSAVNRMASIRKGPGSNSGRGLTILTPFSLSSSHITGEWRCSTLKTHDTFSSSFPFQCSIHKCHLTSFGPK